MKMKRNVYRLKSVKRVDGELPSKYEPILGERFIFVENPEVGQRMEMMFLLDYEDINKFRFYNWSTRPLIKIYLEHGFTFETSKAIYQIEDLSYEIEV